MDKVEVTSDDGAGIRPSPEDLRRQQSQSVMAHLSDHRLVWLVARWPQGGDVHGLQQKHHELAVLVQFHGEFTTPLPSLLGVEGVQHRNLLQHAVQRIAHVVQAHADAK